MSRKTNCPNCGAPLPANGKCEYCGTMVILSEHEIPVVVKLDRAVLRELIPNDAEVQKLTPLHGHDRRVRMYDPKSQMWIWVAERKKNDGEQTNP